MRRTLGFILSAMVVFLALLSTSITARADNFTWTYNDPGNPGSQVTASGTLTTGAFSGGQATITDITGTVNGTAIASLLSTSPGYDGNDNILYYPASTTTLLYISGNGVAFSLTGGDNVIIYGGTYPFSNMVDSAHSIDSYYGIFTVTPVPESSTIFLLAVGLLGLAALRWRRKVQV